MVKKLLFKLFVLLEINEKKYGEEKMGEIKRNKDGERKGRYKRRDD